MGSFCRAHYVSISITSCYIVMEQVWGLFYISNLRYIVQMIMFDNFDMDVVNYIELVASTYIARVSLRMNSETV